MSGELKSVLEDGPIEGEPLVSVCVITYNHGKYIRQCLDGILMQKVNFPYEVLIHDDASPDDTADIIREYWAKYPTVIKPILQTENRYSRGLPIGKLNYERAKGKYIALCEGDDYWTDEGKLQMQVDFLEEHGEYVGTAHNVRVVDENGVDVPDEMKHLYPAYEEHKFTITDTEYMRLAGQYASIVYRNIYRMASQKMLEEYYRCHGMGDRKLAVLITLYGDIHCFPEAMSVYRYVTTSGTSWSARVRGKNISLVLTNYYLDIMDFAEKWFSRDLWMEPALFVTMLASILHIVRKRDRTDIDITRRILCNFRFWKRIMCRIYAHPFMMVKRTYTYIFLPKNSTVGYRPKRHHK